MLIPWSRRWLTPFTRSSRARRRETVRPTIERLEDRWVPTTAMPPGHYHGIFTSNTQFLDTSGPYVIDGNLTVALGATLTVGAGVTVQIEPSFVVLDNGTITIGTGATVTAQEQSAGFGVAQEGITVNGTLTASGVSFARTGTLGGSLLQVNAGGQLTASSSDF